MSSTRPEPGSAPDRASLSAAGLAVDEALDQVVVGLDGFASIGLVGLSDGELVRERSWRRAFPRDLA